MKNSKLIQSVLESNSFGNFLKQTYRSEVVDYNIERYRKLLENFTDEFEVGNILFVSSPGRTEIVGNHTDHNNGKVLAASIDMDVISVVSKTGDNNVKVKDLIYKEIYEFNICDTVKDLSDSKTMILLKGIVEGFKQKGFNLGGFNACISSNVLKGAGVSSSAAFGVMICKIIDKLYNQNKIKISDYAKIGQYSENEYWGKKSGLLDQIACAYGGLISIDFKDNSNPLVHKIEFDFDAQGYDVFVINTGGDHSELGKYYSSIPEEMIQVANSLGKEFLRDVNKGDLLSNIVNISKKCGDRAILRALHFLNENERVENIIEALNKGIFSEFLSNVKSSGESSWKLLQNCYCEDKSREQKIPLALALTEEFINEIGTGACRIHGGGFAGVILALIPKVNSKDYVEYISRYFSEESVYKMSIRNKGVTCSEEQIMKNKLHG